MNRLVPIAQGIHADILLKPAEGDLPTDALARAAERVVVKLVSAPISGVVPSRRPHDVVREVRILRRVSHPNIVQLLEYTFDPARLEHTLTLPLLALTLDDLLENEICRSRPLDVFLHTARGALTALEYLHSHDIAHRDIKPANIMFAFDSTPVLIDFGTAWDGSPKGDGGKSMSCSVGSGPYRAPELLFSPAKYDATALDLWSAGVSLSEVYRPRGTRPRSIEISDDDSDGGQGATSAPEAPPSDEKQDDRPAPLFSAQFGELGLASSIFRLLGTPTRESWPGYASLPDADKVAFDPQPERRLGDILVAPPEIVTDILENLVRLEPARRRNAKASLALLPQSNPDYIRPLLLDLANRVPA